MEKLKVEKPLYPLICLLSSIIVFIIGMIIAKSSLMIIYLTSLVLLYIIFSYGKFTFKLLSVFMLVSLLPALLAFPIGGIKNSIQIYLRFICFIVAAIPSIGTPPINLVRNLDSFKVPRFINIAILITVRFVPILMEEIRQVRYAMKTRGVNISVLNPKIIYRAMVIPIIMRILSISDLLSLSLDTRGFVMDDNEATKYKTIKISAKDVLYLISLIIISIVIVCFYTRGY